jgi:hypothetical protein
LVALLAAERVVKRSTYLLTGLVRLHRELGRDLALTLENAEKLRTDMHHIEAVLHIIEPTFDARRIAVLRRRNPPAKSRGRIMRLVLDVLRRANRPLTVAEIANEIVLREGGADQSREERDHLRNTVISSLKYNHGKSVVGDSTFPRKWKLNQI